MAQLSVYDIPQEDKNISAKFYIIDYNEFDNIKDGIPETGSYKKDKFSIDEK